MPDDTLRLAVLIDADNAGLPHVAWCCEGRGRTDASLGLDNGRRAYRWRVLGVFRSRWGIRCAATADDVRRIAAVGGARSSTGPRFPERTYRLTGLNMRSKPHVQSWLRCLTALSNWSASRRCRFIPAKSLFLRKSRSDRVLDSIGANYGGRCDCGRL